MYIQLGFDFAEAEQPAAYRFSALVAENFSCAPDAETPFLNLAAELLDQTAQDLKAGLDLVRRAVDTGERLSHRRDGMTLNYMLYAIDWLNETDEGGVCLPETAAQLDLSPRTIRRHVASAYHLETRGPLDLLCLPASFFIAITQLDKPSRRSRTPAAPIKPRALKADTPQIASQPALFAAWANVVKPSPRAGASRQRHPQPAPAASSPLANQNLF